VQVNWYDLPFSLLLVAKKHELIVSVSYVSVCAVTAGSLFKNCLNIVGRIINGQEGQ
jgi:hypothetical protein